MKTAIIVHHSGDSSKGDQYDKIRRYHNAGAGGKWPAGYGIQYAFLIEKSGIVKQGRQEGDITWHSGTAYWNKRAIAICLAGDFTKEQPRLAQILALAQLVAELQARWGIPEKNILNHYEVRKTRCPGINFRPVIRDEKARIMNGKIMRIERDLEQRQRGSPALTIALKRLKAALSFFT